MSLTSANIPSPTLAWQFQGITTDSVTGLTGTTTGSISYVSGKYNQAVNINNPTGATANYVSYSLVSSSFSATSFTWAYWANYGLIPVPGTNVQSAVYFTDSLGSYTQFRVTLNGTRNSGSRPYMYNNSTYLDCPIINQSIWNHYCVVLTSGSGGSTITLYFNGALVGSFVGNNNQGATLNNMYVGSANTQYGAICAVDDLRLFNTSLTATQVQTIYSQNGNPSLGSAALYKSPGYTTPSRLFSVGTPASGSVLAYSYSLGGGAITATMRCVGVDAGSNVYSVAAIGSTFIPLSLKQIPTQYPAYFPGAQNMLVKYNKNGDVVGVSQIMTITAPTVNSIKSDPQSNVYMLLSGVLGTSNLYTINATNSRTLGASLQAGVTNVIKYGPDGSLISWGGFPIVTGFTATLYSLALDAGSNVYICGYYQSTTSVVGITNIANPPVLSASSLPITGVYFWPVLLKWSSTGTFLGYSIIRCTAAAAAVVTQIQLGQALCPDTSGNIYWGGTYGSNLYCNVNTISTTEPVSNIYSLNTTKAAGTAVTTGSNAFVIQYGPVGVVNKFTELGYGPAASGTQYTVVRGIGLSSTGNVYIGGSFATNSVAGVKLNNFGLVDPRTGSFLTQSGVTVVAAGGSQILMCYNSSGTALAASQSQVVFSSSGGAVVVDKNDNIYQAFTHGGQQVTIQNLGQTSSGLVTGLNSVGTTNSTVVKFNAAGAAVGFSDFFSSAVNYPSDALAVNNDGVFCVNTFTQVVGSAPLANVAAITTTTGAYVYTLPSTFGVSAGLLIKWAL